KAKVERNLRIARDAVAAAGDDAPADLLLDLGRSLKAAGHLDEAAQRCIEAAAAADPGTPTAGAALHFAASCLLGLGRIDDALAVVTDLRAQSRRAAIADFLEAQAELQRARPQAALALLDGIDDLVDDQGKRLSSGVLPLHRGMALAMLEQWKEAAAALSQAVAAGAVQGNLSLLVTTLGKA